MQPMETSMTRLALAYATLLAVAVVAANSGHLPSFAQYMHDLPGGDKVLHFLMFGTLALVANLALAASGKRRLARAIVTGCLIAAIVATVEEFTNQFVPSRDWSLGDLTANYLGIAVLGMLPFYRRSAATNSAAGERLVSSAPRSVVER
jgi:polysaccharide biosynthesis protein VpsQ